ncbi:TPA: hypothetical protein ACGSTT_001436 [Vibrio parahaemolyticus]
MAAIAAIMPKPLEIKVNDLERMSTVRPKSHDVLQCKDVLFFFVLVFCMTA